MAVSAEELVTRLTLTGRSAYSAELKAAAGSVAGFRGEVTRANSGLLGAVKSMTLFGGGIQGITTLLKAGAVAAAGIGIAAVAVGVKLVGVAADADKAHSRYMAVLGSATSQTDRFIANLQTKFGTPTPFLESTIAQFARLGQSVKLPTKDLVPFSESLTQASLDLASFYNMDPEKVSLGLQRGVAGQMRSLKALGIVIREQDVTERAAQMGLGKNVSEGTRMMIRQQMIMEQVGVVTKNLSKDQASLANQTWQLRGRIKEAEVSLGRLFTPIALLAVTGLNHLLIPATQKLKDLLPGVQREFAATGPVVSRLKPIIDILSGAFDAFSTGGPMGFVDWLDKTLNTGTFFHTMLSGWVSILQSVWTIVTQGVIPALHTFAPLTTLLSSGVWAVSHALGFVADHIDGLTPLIYLLVGAYLVWKAAAMGIAIVEGIKTAAMIVSDAWATVVMFTMQAYAAVLWLTAAAEGGVAVGAWGMLAPFLIIIAIIAVLAVGVYLLYAHFDEFKNGLSILWGVIQDNPFVHFLAVLVALATGFGGVWLAIEYGPEIVSTATGGIVTAFDDVIGAMEAVGRFGERMWDGMVSGVKAALNFVIDILESGINLGIELLNEGITAVNHIPGVYINHIDYVNLPRLHEGGHVVSPGVVNMRPGEEMVALPGGATVVPLNQQRAAPPVADNRPQLIQLVVDRKVLAEVMADGSADIEARR